MIVARVALAAWLRPGPRLSGGGRSITGRLATIGTATNGSLEGRAVTAQLADAAVMPARAVRRSGPLARVRRWITPVEPGPIQRGEWLALGVIMLVALALRWIALDSVPLNITADESDNLKSVWQARVTGQPGVFGLDWKPSPAFSIQLFRASMAVFGDDVYGMRMLSAILSVIGLLPFYALARRTVQAPAARLTSRVWSQQLVLCP